MKRVLICLLLTACGEAPADFTEIAFPSGGAPPVADAATGGAPSPGGSPAAGGFATGGSPETGGAIATGGAFTGGAGSGGARAVNTGGVPSATGGAPVATGGASSTGGAFGGDAGPATECVGLVNRPCGDPQRCPLGRQQCQPDGSWGACIDAQSGQVCL